MDTGQIPVPSAQDRTGNLSDLSGAFVTTDANGASVPTTVSGPFLASQLSQKLGYAVNAGEPYFTPGCNSAACVFPGAIIPQSAWSAPAQNLLQYIPSPNLGANTFATSSSNLTLRDDKGAYRLDANTRWGLLSAYYFLDDWSQNNPYPVAQGGANVPGFSADYLGRAQLLSLGDTKNFGSTSVNEFRFSLLRNSNDLGKPVGGLGVTLASQGFVTGPGTPGIVALSPKTEGVESVGFNSFTIGTNTKFELHQDRKRMFQWLDNFTKVIGTHTLEIRQANINTIRSTSTPSRSSTAAFSFSALKLDRISRTSCSGCRASTTRASFNPFMDATNMSASTVRTAGASTAASR